MTKRKESKTGTRLEQIDGKKLFKKTIKVS